MLSPALLGFAVLVAFSPELAEALHAGDPVAWQDVAWGIEAGALWGYAAVMANNRPGLDGALCRAVCWWMAIEGAMRAAARLALGVHEHPDIPADVNALDYLTGLPMTWVSLGAAVALAAILPELTREE